MLDFPHLLEQERQKQAQYQRAYDAWKTRLTRPLRVSLVFPTAGVGGVETVWREFWQHIDPAVIDLRVVVAAPPFDLVPHLEAGGLQVAIAPTSEPRRLSEWLQEELRGQDVVQLARQSFWPAWPRLSPQTVFCTFNGANRAEMVSDQQRARLDLATNISRAAAYANQYAYRPDTVQTTILFGTPLIPHSPEIQLRARQRLGLPEDKQIFLWLGRMFSWEKNLPLLRQAIEATAGQPVHWVVLGYFEQEAERAAWQQFIAGQAVTWREDVNHGATTPYYQATDWVVSTSSSEGLGLTVIEGMAAGKPVLATDSGGVRDSLIPGQTGLLSDIDDASFLAKLAEAVRMPSEQRLLLGQNGQALAATRFNPTTIAQQYLLTYQAALDAKRAAPTQTRPQRTVVFLSQAADQGGLNWRVGHTATQLARRGYHVRFIFKNRQATSLSGSLLSTLQRWGTPAECASDYLGRDSLTHQEWEEYLARRLPELEPDIVQLVWIDELPAAAFAGPWQTNFWIAGERIADRFWAQPELADRLSGLFCVCANLIPTIPERWQHKAIVVPIGLDDVWHRLFRLRRPVLRQALGLREDEPTIIWAGRVNDYNKRPDRLYRLACRLPHCRFIVAAIETAPIGLDWERQLDSLPNVIWARGFQPDDMPGLYAAADFGLSTSDSEGLSQSLLEMLASSLPLVSTDCSGARELIDHGANGFIVPKDDEDGLTSALEQFIALSPAERRAWGNRSGTKASRQFNLEHAVRAYLTIYRADFDYLLPEDLG